MKKLVLIAAVVLISLASCKKKCLNQNIILKQTESYTVPFDGEVNISLRNCSQIICYINGTTNVVTWSGATVTSSWDKHILPVSKNDKITWSSSCSNDDLFLFYKASCGE